MNNLSGTIWGQTLVLLDRTRKVSWVDLIGLVAFLGILYGILDLAEQWQAGDEVRQRFEIDLSPWALPRYTFFSLCRGLLAYGCSLGFTLVYGYWAAKDRLAEPILITMLDILQSVPVLGFMPGVVLALVAAFPNSNVGLELAAVLMIFTGQAWNMTFSFYHSVKAVPADLREAAKVYGFSWWQTFRHVELSFSMTGLVWNSMMSMAGGWFFLMIVESFRLGTDEQGNPKDFRLPGIGAYASKAIDDQDYAAMGYAILAMVTLIVVLDQLLWRPVVVWAQKFRLEEGTEEPITTSWFLDWLRRSRLLAMFTQLGERLKLKHPALRLAIAPTVAPPGRTSPAMRWITSGLFLLLMGILAYGAFQLFELLIQVDPGEWAGILLAAGLTLGRVLVAVALGTLWTVPAGLAIGLSPRWLRVFQPLVQIAASFPAPMLFPLVLALLYAARIPLGIGSIVLMTLGIHWYILFNVIAGSTLIPADLQEAAKMYGIRGWQRFWQLYVPAIFPYLVTGWVTAAGGAWNASIVTEYIASPTETKETWGLGAEISKAASAANFPLLAASVVVMALVVVVFNRTVWHRLYQLARQRYAVAK